MSTFEIFNPTGIRLDENARCTQYDGVRFDSLKKARTWVEGMIRKERLDWVVAIQKEDGSFWYVEEHMVPHEIKPEWFDCFAVTAKEYPDVGFSIFAWRYTKKGWAALCDDDGWVLMNE